MKYRVKYEIDVEADSELDAARHAYGIMVAPDSMPPVLSVQRWADEPGFGKLGPAVDIDLDEEIE